MQGLLDGVLSGSIADDNNNPLCLSFHDAGDGGVGTVPDSGSTLLLLGSVLGCVEGIRRWMGKR